MTPELDKIYLGDALETLKGWPDSFVHCCVCSPPYWRLRDYGVAGQLGLEKTPQEYVAKMVDIFREVRRVLRDDGTLWLNIDDSYLDNGELACVPWMLCFALRDDGWRLRCDVIWEKSRYLPTGGNTRPTRIHEYIFFMTKSKNYFYDGDAIREKHSHLSLKRAQTPVNSLGGKNGKLANTLRDGGKKRIMSLNPEGKIKSSVWLVSPADSDDHHFAQFSPNLIVPCILAGSPINGIIADPFMGAGTTALVAARLNRRFIGCELNPEYIRIAEKRIAHEIAQGKML